MARRRAILLAAIVLATLLPSCVGDNWDGMDRSGFQATATASVRTEMTRRAMEVDDDN